MQKVLISYFPVGEVFKVVKKFEEIFKTKNIEVDLFEIKIEQDYDIKKQFKNEKQLTLKNKLNSINQYDLVIIGTPLLSFTSAPGVNAFIRELPNTKNKKFVLFVTGIGLPGNAVKKMSSLLSMNGANVIDTQLFSSIFEFDTKKLKEVNVFVDRFEKNI